MTAVFVVDGKVQGKARPRAVKQGNRVRMYTPKETRDYETLVASCYRSQCHAQWFCGALSVTIYAQIAVPKSYSKRKRSDALEGALLPVGKPDMDNIAKVVLDALTGVAWTDDRQVTRLTMRKRYGDAEYLLVKLETDAGILSGGADAKAWADRLQDCARPLPADVLEG